MVVLPHQGIQLKRRVAIRLLDNLCMESGKARNLKGARKKKTQHPHDRAVQVHIPYHPWGCCKFIRHAHRVVFSVCGEFEEE